ncbi:MAG TPA: DUF2461 domain-containing protein [Xanthomonadaceae bacterium]|nr:DUF2461 domain-containing protein [Xanthomonadaceae bacterium]
MPTYFTAKTFRFQRALVKNNSREWFTAHKADYEEHLKQPFLRLITDLQAPLAKISTHFRADPKPTGGSLFRIYRDTRFANDKTPYKAWAGARFFHERVKVANVDATLQRPGTAIEAPSFYLHIQPGNCFVGGGLWHPEPATQRRIRDFIVENPESWKRATRAPAFRRKFDMHDESLSRPPRGYPANHELIDDLKRKNHVAMTTLDDATVTGSQLLKAVGDGLRGCAPLIDYLCAALDLEF